MTDVDDFGRGSFAFAFFEFSPERIRSKRKNGLLRRQDKFRLEARKHTFEVVQSDLEQCVEMLSDVVARKRLRASKIQIEAVTRYCNKHLNVFSA